MVSVETVVRKRTSDPHSKSVQLAIEDVAGALQQHMGQALLAVVVGKNVRTVARWSAGAARPVSADEKLLRDAYQVLELVLTVEESLVARAWFMGMNPLLDDMSPVEALAGGQARLVLAAARAYVDAG